ncbi:MAG: hypothetical protein WDZ59_01030 [Pirellulales bacterium]
MPAYASRNLLVLTAAFLLAADIAVAQYEPVPGASILSNAVDNVPPELALPEPVFEGVPEELPQPVPFEIVDGHTPGLFDLPLEGIPAPVESSGTWFRRGFWYFNQEAVIFNRAIKEPIGLATDQSVTLSPTADLRRSERSLVVNNSKPGADAAARFTIGRFLFRDAENRDNTMEFVYLAGLGDWMQEETIVAASGQNDLTTVVDPFDNGFNGTQRQHFYYTTDFDNFEINYRLQHRPENDRMMLEPDGTWVRRIDPALLRSYLFGIRFLSVREDFRWIAQADDVGAGATRKSGDIQIGTNNDLLGFQFGGGLLYQADRWNVGLRGGAGPYVNFASQNTQRINIDLVTDTATVAHQDAVDETFAVVGDLSIFATYYLRPNMSVRVGYEGMFIQSLAIAPEQPMFDGGPGSIRAEGSQLYNGMSVGLDVYW